MERKDVLRQVRGPIYEVVYASGHKASGDIRLIEWMAANPNREACEESSNKGILVPPSCFEECRAEWMKWRWPEMPFIGKGPVYLECDRPFVPEEDIELLNEMIAAEKERRRRLTTTSEEWDHSKDHLMGPSC